MPDLQSNETPQEYEAPAIVSLGGAEEMTHGTPDNINSLTLDGGTP